VAPGADLILTKTVPVHFAYSTKLITDPRSSSLVDGGTMHRRVEWNYIIGAAKLRSDPVGYDTQIVAKDPVEKLFELDPGARDAFLQP